MDSLIRGRYFIIITLFLQLGSANAAVVLNSGHNKNSHDYWPAVQKEGFNKGAQEAGFSLGAGTGATIFGSSVRHDHALAYAHYGQITSNLLEQGHWYAGNVELRAELIAGSQFSPDSRYIIGAAFGPRYYFATSTHWIPFIDLGIGAGATDISHPDLSTTFEFFLQLSAGTLYMLKDNLAFSFEVQEFHISNAGLDDPNNGVNTIMFIGGLSWFF
jgi:hypothetical protein